MPSVPFAPISVADVALRIKQRADVEKSGSAGIVSDPELLGLINLYHRRLLGLIQESYEYYTATYYNIQTVNNVYKYALPADFYKLLGIGLVNSPGENYSSWTPLQHWDMYNQSSPTGGFMNFTNGVYANLSYRLVGGNIVFRSQAQGGQYIGIWYCPSAVPFKTLGAAEFMPEWMKPGWEEYIVCGCAAMVAAKEERSIELTKELWAQIEKEVRAFVPNRDSFQPERVVRAWTPRSQFQNWPFFGNGNGNQ